MSRGKAFFVVGHKQWGKSTTLKALTENRLYHVWEVNSLRFVIKRMSNDDEPRGLKKFVEELDSNIEPRVIAALCPTFNDKKSLPLLLETLAILKRKYELFFFVLRHKCSNPDVTVPDDEIDKLERYGRVKQFLPEGAKAEKIARAFKNFISQHA